MKKTLFLLATCLLASFFVNAQDLKLDEILKKHFAAAGQDKVSNVKSVKMTGKQSMMGMEFPFTLFIKRPGKSRLEAEIQGSKMIQTYNGVEGYMLAPWTGSTEPQKIGDDQLAEYKERSDLDGQFFNYKEKGNQLELVGVEDVNGKKAYKLKLVEKAAKEGGSAKTSFHFIDCENFNLVKTSATANMQGAETEMETYFTNYKQVEGVLRPYSMEIKTGGNSFSKITIEEIKTNEELADDLFEKPTK